MFIGLYNFFSRHKAFLYTLLILSSLLFSFFALRVHFEEDISKLVPGAGESESSLAFNSLKVKDKVFLQFPSASPEEVDAFMQGLLQRDSSISNVLYRLDNGVVLQAVDYALEHLPTLVDPSLYSAIDQAIAQADSAMARNREILWADESGQASQRVFMDPLGITQLLLPEGGLSAGFTLKDGQIYSNSGTTALAFLSPTFPTRIRRRAKCCSGILKRKSRKAAWKCSCTELRCAAWATPAPSNGTWLLPSAFPS